MRQWFAEYQARDIDIVDYQEFTLPGCEAKFRGPGFDPFTAEPGSFFTCVGAAQTYGCFYEHPFPSLLADRIGLKALNLGIGGAGPGFYLHHPSLIEAMNRGRFVVLQAMAARHESNGRFDADGYVEFLKDKVRGDSVDSSVGWRRIIDEELQDAPARVAEGQRNWVETTRQLVAAITVPVIFLWFSRRDPDRTIDWDAVRTERDKPDGDPVMEIYGEFPQIIDKPTANAAAELCKAAVYCHSDRGMGAALINRHTGLPLGPATDLNGEIDFMPLASGLNLYYPSPEMHQDAADALEPVVRRIIDTVSD